MVGQSLPVTAGGVSAYSTAPGGAGIVYELAGRLGWRTQRRITTLDSLRSLADQGTTVQVVLAPRSDLGAHEIHNLLENVRRVSQYIRSICIVGPVKASQGEGFLLGLRTSRPAKQIQAELLEGGILAGTANDSHILRLLPPFILQEEHVDMLRDALASLPA